MHASERTLYSTHSATRLCGDGESTQQMHILTTYPMLGILCAHFYLASGHRVMQFTYSVAISFQCPSTGHLIFLIFLSIAIRHLPNDMKLSLNWIVEWMSESIRQTHISSFFAFIYLLVLKGWERSSIQCFISWIPHSKPHRLIRIHFSATTTIAFYFNLKKIWL